MTWRLGRYSRTSNMEQSIQFALDFAQAFEAEIASGRYGTIEPMMEQPPRFNYRLARVMPHPSSLRRATAG